MARVKHTANRRDRKQSLAAAAAPPSPAPSPSPPARNSSRVPTTPTSPGSRKKNARTEAERERKKRRYRPGTVALREIRHFQKTVKLVIPSAPFIRAVREVTGTLSHDVTRWTAEALEVIHEAAEDFLVHLFEDSMLCAIHAKRVTLMKKDLELARRIRGVGRQW